MARILCLRFPNWPLQRLQNARPELKRRPLAVYEARQGLRVVASNQPDVLPGMPLAEATGVHLEPYDPLADRATLERVAEWCEQFSPLVALEEVERPDCLFLDITGLAPVFHGEDALAERICRAFARRSLEIQVAIADTIGLAWGLARYGEPLCIAEPGDLSIFVRLPVAALRLPSLTVQLLGELGIHQVGQLLSLPRAGLATRFGQALIDRIDQALGDKTEIVSPHRGLPEITIERQFEFPIERQETLDAVLGQLLEEIAAALGARHDGAIQLECCLGCQQGELKLLAGLFEASSDPRHLHEMLRMRLERSVLPGPVASLRMSVLLSARLVCRQQELFAADQNHERELALLVDRLSNRLGRESVVSPQLVPDAQPEYAYRLEPLAGKKRSLGASKKPRKSRVPLAPSVPGSEKNLPQRPLLLEPRPIQLEVLAVAPEGPPMQFRLSGEQHRTQRSWGPERIQTGWWRGRYIRRDYYRVESDRGRQYWLFRSGGKWFLHGIFD